MQGRAFLDVARTLVSAATEPYWRATVVHAYYALFLECRDALSRWGVAFTPRPNVHSAVRLRFYYVSDPSLKQLSFFLDRWCRKRNDASYNMGALLDFANNRLAQDAIQEITAALALLDAIEADPIRRAAAIAALPP
jgi:16S rRNA A1518/A1519 N6-dimethyltransferase RsmA/KsgA/DIM1 with predicted DNA glycosylase/AP lyase activity